MMEIPKVDMLCDEDMERNNTRVIGGGHKLYYYGIDGNRNGVGIIINSKLMEGDI